MPKRKVADDGASSSSSAAAASAATASGTDLHQLRRLAKRERKDAADSAASGRADVTLASLGLTDVTEVHEMDREAVLAEIEREIFAAAQSILAGRGIEYSIPSRSTQNQLYVPELDRIVLGGGKRLRRSFINVREVFKTAVTTRVMQLVHGVLGRGIHVTKVSHAASSPRH